MATKTTTSKTTASAKKKATASKAKPKTAAADDLDIDIAIEPPKPISVGLGGVRYTVRPIKGSLGISLGSRLQSVQGDAEKLQKALAQIVDVIFGPKDAETVIARLADPEDALDYSHVMELMNKLVERSTGNPTT